MTAKDNTTSRPNRALERLADVLVEDIASTPADQLLAEVAEDYGNARALAATFDKVVLRARTGNDRSVSAALPTRPGRALGGLASGKRPDLAGRLRALWQDVIPPIFDAVFPNRLAMVTVSSVCMASLAVIIAAPTVIDRIQEWHSGAPTDPGSGPSVRGREAETERGVTRGLIPAAAPSGPAISRTLNSPSGPAADSYVVQIALQQTQADAQASVRQLRAKFAKELGDQEAMVRRTDLGPKGVYYRALVGPFGSAEDADRFCTKLTAAGGECTVQKE